MTSMTYNQHVHVYTVYEQQQNICFGVFTNKYDVRFA